MCFLVLISLTNLHPINIVCFQIIAWFMLQYYGSGVFRREGGIQGFLKTSQVCFLLSLVTTEIAACLSARHPFERRASSWQVVIYILASAAYAENKTSRLQKVVSIFVEAPLVLLCIWSLQNDNWGERERALKLMMSMALCQSVCPSNHVRPPFAHA